MRNEERWIEGKEEEDEEWKNEGVGVPGELQEPAECLSSAAVAAGFYLVMKGGREKTMFDIFLWKKGNRREGSLCLLTQKHTHTHMHTGRLCSTCVSVLAGEPNL